MREPKEKCYNVQDRHLFSYNNGPKKVYFAGYVNYSLWGAANKLCHDEFSKKSSAVIDVDDYTLDRVLAKIDLFKSVFRGGVGIAESQAFARYGYDGSSPESAAMKQNDPLAYYYQDEKNVVWHQVFTVYWNGLTDDTGRRSGRPRR